MEEKYQVRLEEDTNNTLPLEYVKISVYKNDTEYLKPTKLSDLNTNLVIGEGTLDSLDSDNYKVNDIVTYKKEKEYITHRIVEISDDEIITKGDYNNTEDDSIKESDIIGKLFYKFKYFGFICYLFSKPKTLIIAFIIGITITILIPDKKKRKESNV